MPRFTYLISLLALASIGSTVAGETPQRERSGPTAERGLLKSLPGIHSRELQLPQMVDFALSADGRHLAAAYYVPAMNRPGTDWDAWVAVWDLTTGARTIFRSAMQPVALSPDGQWLAMELYTRSVEKGRRKLLLEPAVWKTGDAKPAHLLGSGFERGTWLAWAFSPDGKGLFAFDEDGSLVSWEIPGQSPGTKIAALDLGPESSGQVNRGAKWQRPTDLYAETNSLALLTISSQGAAHATWSKLCGQWSAPSVTALGHPGKSVSLQDLAISAKPYSLSAEYGLTFPWAWAARSADLSVSTRVAVALQKDLVAYREPGAALATVRKLNGTQVAQFPATAVQAFTPDATQLIVSDCRGVLRFWDIAAGRIVRSLRLDDLPAETFPVAAIQTASEFGKPEPNRQKLANLVRHAAERGAYAVVLPETAVTGYMSDDLKQTWRAGDRPISSGLSGVDPKDVAETVPGPSTRYFAEIARQRGIYLTVPLLEVDRKTGRYYNTVVLLGPDGGMLIHYRKLNPWPWAERGWASEGNLGHPVVDTPFGRFGVLICFDIHKQAKELSQLKIDTLLYSVAWVDEKESDWFSKRLPRIAADCGFNIVAANWTVNKASRVPTWYGYGQSEIIDSGGRVLPNTDAPLYYGGVDVNSQMEILAELPLPKPNIGP